MRLVLVIALIWPSVADAYPTDATAQEHTKFRRLKWQADVDEGKRRGRKTPQGARWPMARIKLRMTGAGNDFQLDAETPKDPELQEALEAILKKWRWRAYNVAILDITDPANPRYAGVNETKQQTPGSVAKILLGAGLMNALKERYPDDIAARKKLLQETMVPADEWAMPNHHEVPVIIGDPWDETKEYKSWIRRVRTGDTFSLWEWMDHALSPSSNASASTMWREATMMRLLKEEYPAPKYDAELMKRWTKEEFTKHVFDTVDKPLLDAGLDPEDFNIRLFFTRKPGRWIKGEASRASPLGLLRWFVKVEQGKMVDAWSSLELKRMLYLTRRRTRYAFASILNDSGVFFKTGSLYMCREEEGYTCTKYQGNHVNVLNGIVQVVTYPPEPEADEKKPEPEPYPRMADALKAGAGPLGVGNALPFLMVLNEPEKKVDESGPVPHVYMVAVMSNELKRNASSDHALLADEIHKLIVGK